MYLSSDLIPAHLCICLFINLPYVKSGLTACSCRTSLLLLILPFAFRTWIHASLEQRKHCTLFFDCPCGIFPYPDLQWFPKQFAILITTLTVENGKRIIPSFITAFVFEMYPHLAFWWCYYISRYIFYSVSWSCWLAIFSRYHFCNLS